MNVRSQTPLAQIPFKHAQCLFSNAHHKCLHGGRNGAKSWSAATYIIGRASEKKHKIICCRQYQNSIRDSSKALIENRIADLGLAEDFWITNASIRHVRTGTEIIFVGLERSIESIKSLEGATIVWVEEAQVVSMASIEILLPTIRAEGSEFIWTWNPRSASDPVEQMFRGALPRPDAYVCEVCFWDHDFMTEAARIEMEVLREANFKRWEHIYCGKHEPRSVSKVFNNVEIGRPDEALLLSVAPLYGLDFGYNDPTAAVRCYFLAESRTIYVEREAYASGVTYDMLPDFLDTVVARRGDLVWADSAAPGAIQLLESRGHGVKGVNKTRVSVRDGVHGCKIVNC